MARPLPISFRGLAALAVVVMAVPFVANCASSQRASDASSASAAGGGAKLSGAIAIDGSSTVAPISEAIAEEFGKENPDVKPTVAVSGTGGGFKKFTGGELDIAGASRPIEASEVAAAKAKGIEFVEIPIAFDGLTVVVNKSNAFLDAITTDELKKIWRGGSTVRTWRDVNPAWPAQPMKLYGPGTDSGTFDYFTEAIMGKKGDSRSDYQPSEDDNILVKGVQGDAYAMGYFGFSYYDQNQDSLKALKVNGVAPSTETIANGAYTPLSRPLFWYVKKDSLARPEVKAFVSYLLTKGKGLISDTGYVPLPDSAYVSAQGLVDGMKTGTRFKGGETGLKIEDVLAREPK